MLWGMKGNHAHAYAKRIHTLQGQLGAIEEMIAQGRVCTDVVVQLKAVRSGVSSLLTQYLSERAQECLAKGKNKKELSALIKELSH
jgi:DNA-binding FrmR family transcriptional regulator